MRGERGGAVGEQREAGRAAAAHPREQRSRQSGQPIENRGDFGDEAQRRLGQIVAAGRQHRGQPGSVARHRGKPPGSRKLPAASAEHRWGRQRDPRIGQNDAGRRADPRRAPALRRCRRPRPAAPRGRPAHRRRAAPPVRQRRRGSAPPDRWSSTRSVAAASLDPPPIPDAVGRRLSRNSAAPRAPHAGARGGLDIEPGGAQHEIVVAETGERARLRTADRQRQHVRRRALDPVADIGERHQAVEQVIAVGAPPDDMQVQIDLRRGEDAGCAVIARARARRSAEPAGSAAAGSPTPGRRGGGVKPVLDLGLDRLDLVFLRSELQRPAPLVARFDRAVRCANRRRRDGR